MIISNLPINDDIAKKITYTNDSGANVVVEAKDIATTIYVDTLVGDIITAIDSL